MAQQKLPSEVEQIYPMGNGGLADNSSLGGGNMTLTAEEQQKFAQLLQQFLSNPQVLQEIAKQLQQQMKGENPLFGEPGPGAVYNPIAGMPMGTLPGPGPVQWLGGMPPGYNDEVAKKLAQSAIAGNMWSGSGFGQALGQGISKGMGGGMLGGLAGTLAQLAPVLFGLGNKP